MKNYDNAINELTSSKQSNFVDFFGSELILNDNLEIIYVNENAERFIKIHRSRLLNTKFDNIISNFLPKYTFSDLKKSLSKKLKISRIFFVKKLDEWYNISIIPSKEYISVRITSLKITDLIKVPSNYKFYLKNLLISFAIKDSTDKFSMNISRVFNKFLRKNQIKTLSESNSIAEEIIKSDKDLGVHDMLNIENIHFNFNNKAEFSLFQEIADMVPDMLYVTDIVEMRKVFSNKRIHELFNLNMEEISNLGSKFFDSIIYPEDKTKYFDSINELKFANDNEVKELKYRIVDCNKNIHWIKTKRKVFKRDRFGIPCYILGISQDITEQVKLYEDKKKLEREKIKLRIKQQREILNAILSSQEEERRRVAETLHHEVGQLLFAAQLKLGKTNPEVENILKSALEKTRNVSYELTPLLLNDFGLEVALKDLFEKKLVSIGVNPCFNYSYISHTNRNDLDIIIYRITQELLNNTVKYAFAKNVKLCVFEENAVLNINFEDDGEGFSLDVLNVSSKGFGLNSIKNRINLLNGFFEIQSQPQQGVKVLIKIPLD
jgi:signal transduction histidine kinase